MQAYHDLMRRVLDDGVRKDDRTGTGTVSVFGHQMRFDLTAGFPLVTTKKLHLKSIIHELLWFLAGDTNIAYLKANGVRIWDEWADENGELGPVYGHQWRSWPSRDGETIDQIAGLVEQLRTNPDSRRLIVTAWNPADVDRMALPPCHCLFQFYVAGGKLSCQLYQRSADIFLGVPFNIASYALLTQMLAHVTDLGLGDFVHTLGDAHLYTNHLEQARLQVSRAPRPLPTMRLNPDVRSIFDFVYDDFELAGYDPHPAHQGRGIRLITVIAAVADNGVIGADNELPWHCPTDFAYFKRMTLGKPLIMGRKTLQSIGKALPDRKNIVVTRDPDFHVADAVTAPSLDAALAAAGDAAEIMIGGGGDIYRQAMPLADRLLITRVHVSPQGDTHFPAIAEEEWIRIASKDEPAGPRDSHDMTFETWQRR